MCENVHQTIDGGKKQLLKESNKLLINRNTNSRKAARVWSGDARISAVPCAGATHPIRVAD